MLHITVGASASSRLNLSDELKLVKAALLYADKVSLCSISSAMMAVLVHAGNLEDDELLELLQIAGSATGKTPGEIAFMIETYKTLRTKKKRNKQELLQFNKLKSALEQSRQNFRRIAAEELSKAGADELVAALNSGLVELKQFDLGSNELAEEYFRVIAEAVISGETYPLLDDLTGDLVRHSIKEGKLVPLGASVNRAKQVGLSSGLFGRLPLFDNAKMDEVIDIRKELDKSLTRFRAAIIGFAKDVEAAPWEQGFSQEVDQVFMESVEPAVLEIEEAVKSNKLLLDLVVRSSIVGVPALSVLGILLSNLEHFPSILATAGIAATAGAYEVAKKHRERSEEIERKPLYFYYQTHQVLLKK